MPYIVVRNDKDILSRPTALGRTARLAWYTRAAAEASNHQDTILFDTHSGASKCAGMQGGSPCWVADVARGDGTACGVGPCGNARGLVEVE